MTLTNKSIVFLAITFAVSWGVALGAHFARLSGTVPVQVTLFAMMMGPAVAAIICAFAFEKGRRIEALGLHFRPNLWWLYAWLIPIALAVAAVVFSILFSSAQYADIGDTIVAQLEAQGSPQAETVSSVPNLGLIVIAASIVAGALFNFPLLTFSEELGWRGYLHYLWRPSGFWRASLGTGFIWGLWHAPAIFYYGLNYPEQRGLGIALFTVFCMLLSPIMTLVRDRAGSVWAAGLLHGTFNAVGGLTLAALTVPDFPWNGIVGVGGFMALAIAVALIALLAKPSALAPRPGAA